MSWPCTNLGGPVESFSGPLRRQCTGYSVSTIATTRRGVGIAGAAIACGVLLVNLVLDVAALKTLGGAVASLATLSDERNAGQGPGVDAKALVAFASRTFVVRAVLVIIAVAADRATRMTTAEPTVPGRRCDLWTRRRTTTCTPCAVTACRGAHAWRDSRSGNQGPSSTRRMP
jgi:hypothetical protein